MLKPSQPRFWVTLVSLVVLGLLSMALLVLLPLPLFKHYVGELRMISAESMKPALQLDDRVFVQHIQDPASEIRRGDILVFYPPMTILKQDPISVYLRESGLRGLVPDDNGNVDVASIKRVIGLPGERIKVVSVAA